jgi:spore coat protein SA
MPRVFHLLPEGEPFSEFHGGAISRWVANVLRGDLSGFVVCAGGDGSWKFAPERVMTVLGLSGYQALLRRTSHRVPWRLRKILLRFIFGNLLRTLHSGDTIWVHNRPEIAAALAQCASADGQPSHPA